MLKNRSGGFVLAEFAIALPLLILLGAGLVNVGAKIFSLGKIQVADYVLETEAQYVMERIIHQARAAKEVEVAHFGTDVDQIMFLYHTSTEDKKNAFNVADVLETQYFIPDKDDSTRNLTGIFTALDAKRQPLGPLTNPIIGANSFGKTKINVLKYGRDEKIYEREDGTKKTFYVLHITLEMESFDTEHRIRLATAVFMPACENFRLPEDWQ